MTEQETIYKWTMRLLFFLMGLIAGTVITIMEVLKIVAEVGG